MRQRMLEAISYPRSCVLKNIDHKDCPHDGLFESSSKRCQGCDLGKECHWLSCLDKLSDLDSKPTHAIHASLVFGLSLIEAENEHIQHDSESCACDSCTWARDAQQLAQEFQTLSLGDRYRSVY
jgi:hypothetical protein